MALHGVACNVLIRDGPGWAVHWQCEARLPFAVVRCTMLGGPGSVCHAICTMHTAHTTCMFLNAAQTGMLSICITDRRDNYVCVVELHAFMF